MSMFSRFYIPILYINYLNVEVDNEFMNIPAILSLENICWFAIWFCVDLKDSLHMHIRVIVALTHLRTYLLYYHLSVFAGL